MQKQKRMIHKLDTTETTHKMQHVKIIALLTLFY